jgi:hypothetical protein
LHNAQELEDDLIIWFWIPQYDELVDDPAQPHGEIFYTLTVAEVEYLILVSQLLHARHPNAVVADPHRLDALPRLLSRILRHKCSDHLCRDLTAYRIQGHPVHLELGAARIKCRPEPTHFQFDSHQERPLVVIGFCEK